MIHPNLFSKLDAIQRKVSLPRFEKSSRKLRRLLPDDRTSERCLIRRVCTGVEGVARKVSTGPQEAREKPGGGGREGPCKHRSPTEAVGARVRGPKTFKRQTTRSRLLRRLSSERPLMEFARRPLWCPIDEHPCPLGPPPRATGAASCPRKHRTRSRLEILLGLLLDGLLGDPSRLE